MVASTFHKVMPNVFTSEGGYVDHPRDPGGATNMGITHITLADWRGHPVTKADVRNLSRDEATKIYRHRYWNAINGDSLPAGLDYAVFDFAINSGPKRAAQYLQRIVDVPADGKIGPVTIGAVRENDPSRLVHELCNARLAFMQGLSTWSTFGKGWTARVAKVRQQATELARYGHHIPAPPDVAPIPGTPPTGVPDRLIAKIAAAIVALALAAAAAWFKLGG